MLKKMARKYMQLPEDQGGCASLLTSHKVAVVMSNIPLCSAFQCAVPATCLHWLECWRGAGHPGCAAACVAVCRHSQL